jgi:hypothetical protein
MSNRDPRFVILVFVGERKNVDIGNVLWRPKPKSRRRVFSGIVTSRRDDLVEVHCLLEFWTIRR